MTVHTTNPTGIRRIVIKEEAILTYELSLDGESPAFRMEINLDDHLSYLPNKFYKGGLITNLLKFSGDIGLW